MLDKKIGYYTCDNLEFESKILAFFHSNRTGKPVEWIFNDQEFRLYNWKVEPSESLDFFYNKRAKELREKYDYLIISYSGGADSHQMLMSFVDQGLLVDEILVNTLEKGWQSVTTIDPNNKSSLNNGAEHYLQTLPRLKEIEKLIPKTKITICDLTDSVYNSFLNVGDASWVLQKREALNPIGITRFNYVYFDEVRKRFDREKSIGLVLGVEKPKTLVYENKFLVRFNDRAANMVSIVDHVKDYDNSVLEYFYWSPDTVPLLIKQGHVIKRWLENNPQYLKYWTIGTSYKTIRTFHERFLRSVVYPSTWNDSWFQVDKAVKDWYSEFDNWFIEGAKGTNAHYIWQEGVEYIKTNLKDFVKLDYDTQESDGLKPFAKSYMIGYMNINN